MFVFSSFRENYVKFGQKWCLKCLDFKKCTQHEIWSFFGGHFVRLFREISRKFGKKSFAPQNLPASTPMGRRHPVTIRKVTLMAGR